MRLQPNIGSDRSWVWKVAADYSEQPPTSETLAIRFANSDSESYDPLVYLKTSIYFISIDAALFKTAFEDGQKINASLAKPADEVKKEEQEEKKPEEGALTDAAKYDEKAEKEEVKKEEVKKEEEEV
jgi:Ran-binding protein 1